MKKVLAWVFTATISFLMVFVLIPTVILSIFFWMFAEKTPLSDKLVAVLELDGVIMDSQDLVKELYTQVYNPRVSGVVLRINSPGGAVAPSQEIYYTVEKLKNIKPIVASLSTVAASGGLYSALSATKIFAQPGTLTGSIGVILEVPNFTKVIDKVGVDVITIKSGQFKDAGNMFRPMSENERGQLQTTVDIAYVQFLDAVATARKIDIVKAREFADGRVILGSQALELGLVDQMGGLMDAAKEVFVQLKRELPAGEQPTLFYPMQSSQFLRMVLHEISNYLPAIKSSKFGLQSKIY